MRSHILAAFTVLACLAPADAAQETGRITGQVVDNLGTPFSFVTVTIEWNGRARSTVTSIKGTFEIARIPAGTYSLQFTFAGQQATRDVTVAANQTTSVRQVVDWEIPWGERLITYAGSRSTEARADTLSAVTTVTEDGLERTAPRGQLFDTVQGTTGVEVLVSDVWDANVNSRGWNDTTNSRVKVRIDGRETSLPFLNFQNWASVTTPLDDFESVELVRGPGSALYGPNAFNGVMVLRSKEPRDSLGGKVRLTAGQLDTLNAELRWAGDLGGDWYLKVVGGRRSSEDFTVPRTSSAEYSTLCMAPGQPDCLLRENPPALDRNTITFGGIRLDRYFSDTSRLTLEGNTNDQEGWVVHSGLGRFQIVDAQNHWGRINYTNEHWDLLATIDENPGDSSGLSTGVTTSGRDRRLQFRAQTTRSFVNDRVHLVTGASYQRTDLLTEGGDLATGTVPKPTETGIFAHVDWSANEHVKLVGGLRWDDVSVQGSRVSPKAGLVYRIAPNKPAQHTLRFTYSEAFRSSSLFGLLNNVDLGPPQDLQGPLCAPYGVDCGLSSVPSKATGNRNLRFEESKTYEIGYTAVIGEKAFITVEAYRNEARNFLSQNFFPQLGTPLGRLNPDFGPWQGTPEAESTVIDPADCPVQDFGTTLADCIRARYPTLSNIYDGTPALIELTFTNLGKVSSKGVDLGVQGSFTDEWKLSANYSWFEATLSAGLDSFVSPNTPRNKYSLALDYGGHRLSTSLRYRWLQDFRWIGGLFQGDVPSFHVVDLDAGYVIGQGEVVVGATVTNLLDNEHWEAFGGSLIGRRGLAYVTYSF